MNMKPDTDDFDDVKPTSPAPTKPNAGTVEREAVEAINGELKKSGASFNVLGHLPATGINAFAPIEGRILHMIANAQQGDVVIQLAAPTKGVTHTNEVVLRRGNYNTLEVYGVISDSISLPRAMKETILPAVAANFPNVTHLSVGGRNEPAFNFLARELSANPEDIRPADGLITGFGIPVPGATPAQPVAKAAAAGAKAELKS